MPLADDIEEFRRNIARATEGLEEVRGVSDKLTECEVDEIYRHLTQIQDLCEQVSKEIKRTSDRLIEINKKWGSEPLKSFSSTRDIRKSLIDTNSFFRNVLQLGLPMGLALDLANIPGDSYVIRNLITSQTKLSGTASQDDPEAALRRLSRIWVTIALGDQGELSTWKALLESGIPPENILIRPNLVNQLGEKAVPDFYCEPERLIVDAKAWKAIHSLNTLQQVVNKYAACFEESGEVRLYFPNDTYKSHSTTLKKLSSPNPSVKVTICAMIETHQDLEWRKQFFYNHIKSYKIN